MTAAEFSTASFVDTNVLVYAFSADDEKRSRQARDLLDGLMRANSLRTSTQVLQELFVTLTRKGARPILHRDALKSLDLIAQFPVFQVDYPAIHAAAELHRQHRLSFWDALIVVATSRSKTERLYTEDLQHGQKILGVEIVNPFR